jgi:hypothetical protein
VGTAGALHHGVTDCVPVIPFDRAVLVMPVFKLPAPKPLVVHLTPDCKQQPPASIKCRGDACEIRLTTAKLEIARLRSLYLDATQRCEQKDECAAVECAPQPCDGTKARRAYAPPPLGQPTERRESLPPDQPAPLKSMRVVTNLGSLIDVLL